MSEINVDQSNFPVRIVSKLKGDLLVDSVSGKEHIGRLFEFDLELLSENAELHFDKVVGQPVTIELNLEDGSKRNFNGLLTEFHYAGASERLYRYKAKMRPWFWFLTRTADCRIFQEKSVPDIIKEVFRDNGMADFDDQLKGKYRKWEYCVQYRESDFNFISRLMEQEGIYYYFEHGPTKHTLVMVDEMATHSNFLDYATIPFNDFHGSHAVTEDYLDYWSTSQSIMPSLYSMRDFDFKKPKADLLSKIDPQDVKHVLPATLKPEVFDYPGEYTEPGDGMALVEIRLQELKCQQERVSAGGNHRGLAPGYTFTLSGHGRKDQEKEHLVLSIHHQINNAEFFGGSTTPVELYRCQVQLMKTDRHFRSARETPKPIVQGPQTAMVVGKSDDEIHTDEFGRVKVQFHWDRYGQNDENSSCWIRVSQLWAGKNWGAMHIPRIGQEVIVSFMEGDPDRPIITGRVYNAVNMPPYDLEGNKTQSGIKSRSTKGGGVENYNELRFEDKKGSEEVYLHAEKNLTIKVEDAEAETVGSSITTNAGATISRSAGADINRTADDNITDMAGKNIVTESGKNMKLTSGGSYELFTNLGIHIKAMNFVAAVIESGAKAAAEAIQKGGGAAAGATMQGGADAGAAAAGGAAQGGLAALSPAIEAGAAELTALQSDAAKVGEGISDDVVATQEKASALSDAIASGASPEAMGAAFMALADAALDAFDDAKKMIEGLFPQIPSIELWAMKDINAHALWSMTLSTKTREINVQAQNSDVGISAKKNITLAAAKEDITIKASKKNVQITGKEKITIKAEDKDLIIEAEKKKVKITSADQIFLKCGKASISMAKSGNIVIKGAKVNITGSGAITMRGKPIKQN